MSLESNKALGGVGAILMVISLLGLFKSAYTLFLLIVGIILVLIALKGFADHYQDGGIFNNALYGVIAIIVGIAATTTIFVMLALQVLAMGLNWANLLEVQQYFMGHMDILWRIVGTVIGALLVFYIAGIVSAILFRKSLNALSARSDEKLFGTAGLVWLIGAVIPLIGIIIVWISWILMAVGFFSIKTAQAPIQPAAIQSSLQPPSP
ncbi:DUF996 domain-containing protein [Candidatus Bathyarchaeota archaeon]|nr:DUF996 domain-containing protein [Candidatus Bathyarchaeota archaeon]